MSLVMPNNNPDRKFCYTYWCYCDWYNECQKNKSRKKTDGPDREEGYDQNEEDHADRKPDPDRAAERIEYRNHREEEKRRPPQDYLYEVDVRYEDGDTEEDEDYGRRPNQETDEEEQAAVDRRGGEEEDGDRDRKHPEQQYTHHIQTHVHEFEGSTKLFEKGLDRHNHRIAGVTGEEIKVPGSHIHKVWTRTDFFDHFHVVAKLTGPAIPVGKQGKGRHTKHIHYVEGATSIEEGHDHQFEFVTQLESPLLPLEEEKRR